MWQSSVFTPCQAQIWELCDPKSIKGYKGSVHVIFDYGYEDHVLNAVFLIFPTFHFTEWKHFPSQISSRETSK